MTGSSPSAQDRKVDDATCAADNLEQILDSRHSCRAFLSSPVERQLLNRLFLMAQKTASWCNAQPWRSHIVSGEQLEQIREELMDHALEGTSKNSDLEAPLQYTHERAARRREAGLALYQAVGIEKDDFQGRRIQGLKNMSFFGAPHVVVVTAAEEMREYGGVDTGAYLATLLLAAESLGIAACPQGATALFSPVLRKNLNIPENERIVATIALGFEDRKATVNTFRTSRASLDQVVCFHG